MNKFKGKYITGVGNQEQLRLIEESFSMLHPNSKLPNLTMLYEGDRDVFTEGSMWRGGWWIQNSYGFAYTSVMFLAPMWRRLLQKGLDLYWERIGDGKRRGTDNQIESGIACFDLIAPDGCLGDCVTSSAIAYRQGDGRVDLYDWFYEASAAGVVMQCELLLQSQDLVAINKYIGYMKRTCQFIEKTRDPENNLFLVGPSCNLLAPSFGAAFNEETQQIEKSYLTGLTITYTAALKKMIELFKLIGDEENIECYTQYLHKNEESMPLLMVEQEYFAKSVEKNGVKHGVYGNEKYGYLEGVCNIDAIAMNVVPLEIAECIYKKIASIPQMRPFDFLVNNYPSLDDTYNNYLKKVDIAFPEWGVGGWVDGGCWSTVEGRAILSYLKLDRFEDAFKSAERTMKWAKDYRQDAPFTEWGENTYNYWVNEEDGKRAHYSTVDSVVDNFAPVTALIRGLLEYEMDAEAMYLIPHIPQDIQFYKQHSPVYYGDKKLFIEVMNGKQIESIQINGQVMKLEEGSKAIKLVYKELPQEAVIKIVMTQEQMPTDDLEASEGVELPNMQQTIEQLLPEDMKAKYIECRAMRDQYQGDPMILERIEETCLSFEVAAERRQNKFEEGYFRKMTDLKKKHTIELYDQAALEMYKGLQVQIKQTQ